MGRYHRLPKRCAGLRASALWKVTHELLCPRRTAAPFSPLDDAGAPKPPATTFLFFLLVNVQLGLEHPEPRPVGHR